jgi:hypothetical protein
MNTKQSVIKLNQIRDFLYSLYFVLFFFQFYNVHVSDMSVGWDVKRCPVSRITTPLARKRSFPRCSKKSRLIEGRQGNPKYLKHNSLYYISAWSQIDIFSASKLQLPFPPP